MYPVVNQETCDGCKNCIEICPCEVYQIEDVKACPVRPEDCIECWACVEQCPTGSISLDEG